MSSGKINFRNTNLFLVFILPVIFLFFGLKKQSEIHEKLMVQGVGIDFLEDKYKVTVQAYDFKNPQSKEEPKIKIVESENETISGALQNLKQITGLSPLYSQNKIIIISEEISKKGIKNAIDFFLRFYENRPSVRLRISKGSAGEILKLKTDGKILKSSEIKDLVDEKFDTKILDFEKELESDSPSSVLFLIEKGENDQIRCENVSLFRNSKLVRELTNEETLGVKILKGFQKIGLCNIKMDEGFISLLIEDVKTKISAKTVNDEIEFEIDIKLSCDLMETTKTFKNTKDMISSIKEIFDKYIKVICEKTIEVCNLEKCDIFKFRKILRNKNFNLFKKIKSEDFLSNAKYNVSVDSKIVMIGIENK